MLYSNVYWLLYILDLRFVLFLCTTAVWQFAINEYVMYVMLCVQLPTSADSVTLLTVAAEGRPCSNRSISPARRATAANPPHAAAAVNWWDRQAVRETGGRTLDSFTDTALHTTREAAITNGQSKMNVVRWIWGFHFNERKKSAQCGTREGHGLNMQNVNTALQQWKSK